MHYPFVNSFFFFFNDTATTEIYTLSLHDALPILLAIAGTVALIGFFIYCGADPRLPKLERIADYHPKQIDRKSTRLNSSHSQISYAVFCLKKKKISLIISK